MQFVANIVAAVMNEREAGQRANHVVGALESAVLGLHAPNSHDDRFIDSVFDPRLDEPFMFAF